MRVATDRDLPGEIWVPIAGYEGFYSVSSLGRVRRDAKGNGGITYAGKVLACTPNRRTGYPGVNLCVNGKTKWALVHILVAQGFLGPRERRIEVNHKNGNKLDARAENLEYVTRSANAIHASRILGRFRGSRQGLSKLKEADIAPIRQRIAAGESLPKIAADYGVGPTAIGSIKQGRTWGHMP